MRRAERSEGSGTGRGFRVLDPGGSGRYLDPLTPPPPPRAPEPYKVAPTSSSLGRAHRRSSFVIIAETRPATPSSGGSPSPTLLATGRVSPFRGRGFKGPPPHAQSRPQSPENHQGRRRKPRFDRRPSVSQQSSPKRSLIPQPTRRRSVSLTKANDGKPSPKFGRRAGLTRKNSVSGNLSTTTGGHGSQRQSMKAPDLSPIQGTPTKPVDANSRVRGGNSLANRASPLKTRSTLTVPKNVANNRRSGQDRSPKKNSIRPAKRFIEEKKTNGENGSPTKIPVRRGSLVNKNGSSLSLASSKNLPKPPKPSERSSKHKNDSKPDSNEKPNENRELRPAQGQKEDKKVTAEPPGSRFIELVSPSDSEKRERDLGLMDLLKQSSGATGTSSVVNTTTTTAVQPLQIEAAALLLDTNRATTSEVTNGKISTSQLSPASPNATPAAGVASNEASLPKTPKVTKDQEDVEKRPEDKEAGRTTSNSMQKNGGKAEPEEPNADTLSKKETGTNVKEKTSKDQVAGGNAKKSLPTRNGLQEGSRTDTKVPSPNNGSRVNNSNSNNSNNSNSGQNTSGRDGRMKEEEGVEGGKTLVGKVVDGGVNSTSGLKLGLGKVADGGVDLADGQQKSDSKSSVSSSNGNIEGGKRTLSRNVGAVNGGKIDELANSGLRHAEDAKEGKARTNHGSESSLKSSNGLSTRSVDSIRSTDTGVSVNTVRGVSSAREKKGTHTMKNSEAIETLSGNLMHLERNGEPAVLDIAEAPEDPSPSQLTRLARVKKSIAGLYERLPSMRCLGCRRNQKGNPWPGQRRDTPAQLRELPANGGSPAPVGESRLRRAWTRFKNTCRCTRLRESRCCKRAARVAPAESTPCCPPERRCGALCRRLFSRCNCCKRSEIQHTRSIRAKHSLTSVAPPPLSEEQRAKIPEVLVEHNSVMRGAIPCLPVPLAWFCLVWNVLLPGSGTVWSGLFNLCVGQPRFSISASPRARFGALVVNLIVGVGQFFTVLFCLVGWGWSIWWGVTMIRLARKYKRFRASEAANGDAEARGGESTGLPPGVPSQALRGMERAR